MASPLRQSGHSTSSQRRVSGFLSTMSAAEGNVKIQKKSFSRSAATSNEGAVEKPSLNIRTASSPSSKQCPDRLRSPLVTKSGQSSGYAESGADENTKENHPWQDQNITANLIRQGLSKLRSPTVASKTVLSDRTIIDSNILGGHEQSTVKTSSSEALETSAILNRRASIILSDDDPESSLEGFECQISNDDALTLELPANNDEETDLSAAELGANDSTPIYTVEQAIYFKEELHAMMFLNSILEQRVSELEQAISVDRLESNEADSNRGKKHKAELKKLAVERTSYEDRANQMISQMSEQMALLQSMAMSRIEVIIGDP